MFSFESVFDNASAAWQIDYIDRFKSDDDLVWKPTTLRPVKWRGLGGYELNRR